MNRSLYFNLCEEKLSTLCTRIELRGKLNLLDLNIHSEDFYVNFLNLLYAYKLENLNEIDKNAAGIDLVDSDNKVVLQVSATATKQKIESALSKDLSNYKGYQFKFISIAKDANSLRKNSYINPHSLVFDPAKDIHDVPSILKYILHLPIAKQQEVYDFLKSELYSNKEGSNFTETNIASIINILAKEDLSGNNHKNTPIPFNIDHKLKFNNLKVAVKIIENYKIYYSLVDGIYTEFDVAGQNKSKSVLDSLQRSYIKLSSQYSTDDLFFQIVEHTVIKVQESDNFQHLPLEELELCVNVLVVDAFIRCSIFEKPESLDLNHEPLRQKV